MSEENQEQKGTETPVTGTSTPAGGKDPHRDAEREKQSSEGDQGQPVAQPASGDAEKQAQEAGNDAPETKTEDTTDTSNQDANASQDANKAPEGGDQSVTGPTPEQQAELDAMVDYTIQEGDIEKMPEDVRAKFLANGGKVGDTIKVAKDHPFVTGQEGA
jgi:hypothetical protein